MPLPIEVYETFEKHLGREDAKTVVKSFEAAISETIVNKWAITKNDLLDEMKKEFATKTELSVEIGKLRADLWVEIANAKTDMIKWMFLFWIGQLAAIIAIIKFFLVK